MLADGIIFFSDLRSPRNKKTFPPTTEFFSVWPKPRLQTLARSKNTHNTEPPTPRLNDPPNYFYPLTWPGREIDQKGSTPSVEQGHCTLIAVKRYRDPPRIGGRHNFLLRPLRSSLNKKRRKRKKLCSTKFYFLHGSRIRRFCSNP